MKSRVLVALLCLWANQYFIYFFMLFMVITVFVSGGSCLEFSHLFRRDSLFSYSYPLLSLMIGCYTDLVTVSCRLLSEYKDLDLARKAQRGNLRCNARSAGVILNK